MTVITLPRHAEQYTPVSDTGWHMVQLDPKPHPVTGEREVVGHTGPMGREAAYLLAAEQANAYDGWLYGMRQIGSDLVMVVDPGDESYLTDDAYPYLDEDVQAVAA